ncbi:MAG: hypothetical protein RLZZ323_1148 [Bacteroidota bacterium]|jgi:hypothetical protein
MITIYENLKKIKPEINYSIIQLENKKTINSIWSNEGIQGVLENIIHSKKNLCNSGLDIINNYKITYKGITAIFQVMGNISMDLSNLRIALQIIEKDNPKKHRIKINLFDNNQVQNICDELVEKNGFIKRHIEDDFEKLTNLLEQYREKIIEEEINPTEEIEKKELNPKAHENAIEKLTSKNLIEEIDLLLEQSGIIGEKENRLLLFIIASSYKMLFPLHGLIQGASGEGKSHLINSIAACMPQEDVLNMTRITSKSLYHYRDKELINKLILIQDFDGLNDEAGYAFREMQSAKFLSSSTVVKDAFGNPRGKIKLVKAHFASLTTTTKAEIYYDNMSRSIVLGVDESQEQTLKIINAQNRIMAGIDNKEKSEYAKQLLRNCIRILNSYEVVNPFATKIQLPLEAKMLRRLNFHFQCVITQLTLLNQFNRNKDDEGRLISTKEDIINAIELFFNSIIIKIDDLDKSTRQFFEKLKSYLLLQPDKTNHVFIAREIRTALHTSKTTTFKYLTILNGLEYIQVVNGTSNRGFRYQVSHWDDVIKQKQSIINELNKQIELL